MQIEMFKSSLSSLVNYLVGKPLLTLEALGAAQNVEHPTLMRIQKMLVRLVQSLELPANPLDQLTELCGGSSVVSEMTGRKGQLIRDEDDGLVRYQNRRAEVSSLLRCATKLF